MKRWNRVIFACAALAAIWGNVSAAAAQTHGAVYGWGYNYYGDPGAGSDHIYNTPVPVSGLSDVVQATVTVDPTFGGPDLTTLLKPDGTVWGRGRNNYGQLGSELAAWCRFRPLTSSP